MSTSTVNIKHATLSLISIIFVYICILLFIDLKKSIFNELSTLLDFLPVAMSMSLLSYVLRYFRWHWLLRRAGKSMPAWPGFLAYLSGFALTATPGKIGELLRIRYFSRLGVRHQLVISAFVYERTFDLIVVLLIALLAVPIELVFRIEHIKQIHGHVNIRWLFGLVRFNMDVPGTTKINKTHATG